MEKVLAMILAGGRGRRMNILCHERPKPALPFAGRFRVIDFSLSNCVHSQINDVAVLTDHQGAVPGLNTSTFAKSFRTGQKRGVEGKHSRSYCQVTMAD